MTVAWMDNEVHCHYVMNLSEGDQGHGEARLPTERPADQKEVTIISPLCSQSLAYKLTRFQKFQKDQNYLHALTIKYWYRSY